MEMLDGLGVEPENILFDDCGGTLVLAPTRRVLVALLVVLTAS